ncbi:unnamed protein product [Pleuronectes platessa]|uniref:Secreted protein n=1 Tax=Pleuronectes platessa TaxID=8262 RepID=A0A9N7V520_PLEPL|nr:unnamed protein product [Pleuronectes platessa]
MQSTRVLTLMRVCPLVCAVACACLRVQGRGRHKAEGSRWTPLTFDQPCTAAFLSVSVCARAKWDTLRACLEIAADMPCCCPVSRWRDGKRGTDQRALEITQMQAGSMRAKGGGGDGRATERNCIGADDCQALGSYSRCVGLSL